MEISSRERAWPHKSSSCKRRLATLLDATARTRAAIRRLTKERIGVASIMTLSIVSEQQLEKALTSLKQIEQWRKQIVINQSDPLETNTSEAGSDRVHLWSGLALT